MKKTIIFILIITVCAFFLINCTSAKKKQLNFVEACYDEKPDREGLPMSQIELLYEGVQKADDTIARQTLRENCPKAYQEYLR